jgi:hypothetical protein
VGKVVLFGYLVIPFYSSCFILSSVMFISSAVFKIILVSCMGTLVYIVEMSSEHKLLMEFAGF